MQLLADRLVETKVDTRRTNLTRFVSGNPRHRQRATRSSAMMSAHPSGHDPVPR